MVTVLKTRLTDEDCRALLDLPDGWTWCEALGLFWVSQTDDIGTETFEPLGPFHGIPEMVEAACRADVELREEAGL